MKKELEDLRSESEHKLKMLNMDTTNSEREISHLKEIISEQQENEHVRKLEIEK